MTPTMRIGANFQAGAKGFDRAKALDFVYECQAASNLVMDDVTLARDMLAAVPGSVVVHRNYIGTSGDEDIWARVSPQKWIDLRGKEADGGIWLYTTNEPGYGPDVLDWTLRLMHLCVPRGIPLVFGGWSVGTPEPGDWSLAKDILKLCAEHPDLLILNVHEYGCGVLTSGLVGGAPDDPRHPNYIYPANWPERVGKLTRFHCGRFQFLVDYCDSIHLPPPRILVTEHGMDDVSDIKFWSEKLRKTEPWQDIKGWRTLQQQWAEWYQGVWSHDRAYFEQLVWADNAIYKDSPVIAQLVYCWGYTSALWETFDISHATELQGYLKNYAKASASSPVPAKPPVTQEIPEVVTKPIPMPKPDHAVGSLCTVEFAAPYRNLRDGNGIQFRDVGDIKSGDTLMVYRPGLYDSNGIMWLWSEGPSGNGWFSTDGVTIKKVNPTTETPAVPATPPAAEVPATPPPATGTPPAESAPQPAPKATLTLYQVFVPVTLPLTPEGLALYQALGYRVELLSD